jgi:hypothetical protein
MTAAVIEDEVAVESKQSRGLGRAQLVIAGLVVVVVGFAAWSTGAYRLPHVDDWAYLRMQDTLDHTGRIVGVGWNDVSLVGQLEVARVVDWFIGDTVLASRLVGIASGIACAALVWWLVGRTRRRDLRPLALLSFIVFPGVTVSWVTSMTDLPATALMLGCLAAGLLAPAGMGRDRVMRTGWLVTAVAAGVAAITVRQLAATAVIAVVGMLLLAPQRPSSRRKVFLVGAAGAVVALAFLWWRSGIDESAANAAFQFVSESTAIARNFSMLGLGLAPIVLATGGLRRWTAVRRDNGYALRSRQLVTALPILWTVFAAVAGKNHSYVNGSPIGAVTFNSSTSAPAEAMYWLFALASAVAGGLLVAVVVADLAAALHRTTWRHAMSGWLDRPDHSLPLAFALTSFAVACASSYLEAAIFERYLFPGFVGVVVLLCSAPPGEPATAGAAHPGRGSAAATVVASLLALVAIFAATDGYTLEAARYRGADLAVAAGIDQHTIDAGFEYVGAHYVGEAHPQALDVNDSYLLAFPGFRRCALANPVVDPPAGSREIGVINYRGALGLVKRQIHVYAVPC